MSSFAKVEDGVVTQVVAGEQDWIDLQDESDKYVQTSYNTRGGKHYAPNPHSKDFEPEEDSGTPLRKNYAGIGMIYDSVRDAFYAPQPYSSWTLDEDTCLWEAPVAYPDDDKRYSWDEDNTAWVEITE